MKILIVCSCNSGKIAPFIQEQGNALMHLGVTVSYFPIKGKGLWGYLKNRKKLIQQLTEFLPDLIHAHYGLSGLLANTQRRIPVVTTYHGSDINDARVFPFSKLNMILSAYNIFVSEKTRKKSNRTYKQSLVPCGIDTALFRPLEKDQARKLLKLDEDKKYILFAGAFANQVKNPGLAQESVTLLTNTNLIELQGYSREEVALLLNAVDVVLMTSFTEGSPQIIKEAMACNCPIVSVPVGDVADVTDRVAGCFISTYQAADVALKLQQALAFGDRTDGRTKILELGLDAKTVACKVLDIYKKVITNK
jgi:glycosyltransferase involved in cell wall biosynthesis